MGLKNLFQRLAKRGQKSGTDVKLVTPRMVIREIEPSDAARILEISKTPGFEYYCFDGTQEKVDDYLKKCAEHRQPDGSDGKRTYIMLAMTLKDTGEFIGGVSLENKHFYGDLNYEVNFFVDPKHQNRGYGREAAVNIMRYAFEDFGLKGINVTIEPDNKSSLAVAHGEGYKEVGDVDIKTPCYGVRKHLVLMLDRETFWAQRNKDKKPMLLPEKAKPARKLKGSQPKP